MPNQVNTVIKQFSPVTRFNAWSAMPLQNYHSQFATGLNPIGFSAAMTVVNQYYPSGRVWIIHAPADVNDVYKITKRDVPELNRFINYREIAIDQYSGKILQVYNFGTGSMGDVFLDWQWGLHSGQAFGWPGRILVFLSGLACPVLFVTGVIRWQQKRRAKIKHQIR